MCYLNHLNLFFSFNGQSQIEEKGKKSPERCRHNHLKPTFATFQPTANEKPCYRACAALPPPTVG